jgi:membrane-associated phospholipid phosphatase
VTARKAWLAALALAVYVLMWVGYALQWNWLAAVDTSSLDALHQYGEKRPAWVTFWAVLCAVFSPTSFRLLALVLIVVALIRRNLRSAVFLLISVELSGAVIVAAKLLANRPRPVDPLVFAPATAFPSGHAVGGMVGVLALLAVILPLLRPTLRAWAVALGVVIVVAVGVGRVVLNVHHPSDVLAGWALGYLYFAVCLLVVPPAPLTATDETLEVPDTAR